MSGILSISPVVTDQQSNVASLLGVAATSRTRIRPPGSKNVAGEDEAVDSATMWDLEAQDEAALQLSRRSSRDGGDDHRHRSRGQYVDLDDEDDDNGEKHRVNTYA
jgi:hypothetical protein